MNLILLCFQKLWNIKNFERLYLKTSIMALEYFFHYRLQLNILDKSYYILKCLYLEMLNMELRVTAMASSFPTRQSPIYFYKVHSTNSLHKLR